MLFTLLVLASCSVDNKQVELQTEENLSINQVRQIPIYENGKIVSYADAGSFRQVTDEELKAYYKLGWLSYDQIETRAHTCQWADGYGGSINCDGGTCSVVRTLNPNGTVSAGIGCYVDGQISHAGLFR